MAPPPLYLGDNFISVSAASGRRGLRSADSSSRGLAAQLSGRGHFLFLVLSSGTVCLPLLILLRLLLFSDDDSIPTYLLFPTLQLLFKFTFIVSLYQLCVDFRQVKYF